MNDQDLDRALTESGERWRRQQPPPPVLDPALLRGWNPARTATVASVAAGVLLVVLGVAWAVSRPGDPLDAGPAQPAASPTAALGVVPFINEPPGAPVPVEHAAQPKSGYVSAPECGAGTQVLVRLAGGQRPAEPPAEQRVTVTVSRVDDARCVLTGPPQVTVLDGSRQPMPVTIVAPAGGEYAYPVTVGLGAVGQAGIELGGACDPEGRELTFRVQVPGVSGTELVGIGAGQCAPGQRPTVSASRFAQLSPPAGAERTRFSGVRAQVSAPSQVPAGGLLSLTVTLTAPVDVALADACPGYRIGVYDPDQGEEHDYALNCEQVPGGVLRAGVPVAFEVHVPVPAGFSGEGKLVWELLTNDRVVVMAPLTFVPR